MDCMHLGPAYGLGAGILRQQGSHPRSLDPEGRHLWYKFKDWFSLSVNLVVVTIFFRSPVVTLNKPGEGNGEPMWLWFQSYSTSDRIAYRLVQPWLFNLIWKNQIYCKFIGNCNWCLLIFGIYFCKKEQS